MHLDLDKDKKFLLLNYRNVLMTTCDTREEAEEKARRWSRGSRMGPEMVTVVEATVVSRFLDQQPAHIERVMR